MKIPERFSFHTLQTEDCKHIWEVVPEWDKRSISIIFQKELGAVCLCAGVVMPGAIRDALNLGVELSRMIHNPVTDENVPRGTE